MNIFNETEKEERDYLKYIKTNISGELDEINNFINSCSEEMLKQKRYIYDNPADFDETESRVLENEVTELAIRGEEAKKVRDIRRRQLLSPYFGRIDFKEEGYPLDNFYIGINSFLDRQTNDVLVLDWRTPAASMFYNYELGEASFTAPMGEITGELLLKRQYRIKDGEMEYMIESSLNIDDDILQRELRRNSSEKMKNIVSTIQREQNMIIRNDKVPVLIIQGAAGSGKTSIALHRVAYLLYHYKEAIASENMMIISPNKVFSDYISGVLPELGEENIKEAVIDAIADSVLGKEIIYSSFYEQVEKQLENEDKAFSERISFKGSADFCRQLDSFIEYAKTAYFKATDLHIGDITFGADEVSEMYSLQKKTLPIMTRLEKTADFFSNRYNYMKNEELSRKSMGGVRRAVAAMFMLKSPFSLYREFYNYIGKPDMIITGENGEYEYNDIFPLCYVKIALEGLNDKYSEIKHLVIDEMQDYSPVQYAVISKLFRCDMTILGDSYQSVSNTSSSMSETIKPFFRRSECLELNNSYRSTLEITEFSKRILNNEKLLPMERHGDIPTVCAYADEEAEDNALLELISDFRKSDFASMGIICKSMKQANELYSRLHKKDRNISLLSFESLSFREGVVITSVHMSKGLEFDRVAVPGCSAENYSSQAERNLLYIACTRAMHKLDITHYDEASEFIR